MAVIDDIRSEAKKLLESGKVEVVVGFAKGTLPGKFTPYFAKTVEDVNNLVWEDGCALNLAKYLKNIKGKAAVVVKGCDSRSLVNLFKERQVNRDDVVIIGANCPNPYLCKGCQYTAPVLADIALYQEVDRPEDQYQDIVEFSELPRKERKDYFYNEVSKCIRCYACRNVCPACYCVDCFVEETLPAWIGKTTNISDNMTFHWTRAIHVAGRCVGCESCARACPMGVDLTMLNRKLAKDVKDLFNIETGLDMEQELVFNEFKLDDPQPFLLGGADDDK